MSEFSRKVIEKNSQLSLLHELHDKETDETKKLDFRTRANAIKTELVDIAVAEAANPSKPAATTGFPSVEDYKKVQLIAAQVAALPRFSGTSPDDVTKFLTCLRQLKKSCILTDIETIAHGRGKFGPSSYRALEAYEAEKGEFTSFDDFTSFIKRQWGAQYSVYQLLENTCAMTRKQNETWTVFNNSLNTSIQKVKNAHSELLKSKNQTVSVDHVFELFQNSIMLGNINSFSHDLYRTITAEANNLQNPNVLAARASTLETHGNFVSNSVLYGSSKASTGNYRKHNGSKTYSNQGGRKSNNSNGQNRHASSKSGNQTDKGSKGGKTEKDSKGSDAKGSDNGKGSGRTAPKSKPKLVSGLQNPNPAYFAASDWNVDNDDESSKNSE